MTKLIDIQTQQLQDVQEERPTTTLLYMLECSQAHY